MKTAVVSLSELGSNCWSAYRHIDACHKCERYDRCTYAERLANKEFDDLRAHAADLRRQSDEAYDKLREMKV